MTRSGLWTLNFELCVHVIRVYRPSQSAPEKHNQSPQTFAHLVNFSITSPTCLITIQFCCFVYKINKPFTCSRCVISVHVISTYNVRKGSWAFILITQKSTRPEIPSHGLHALPPNSCVHVENWKSVKMLSSLSDPLSPESNARFLLDDASRVFVLCGYISLYLTIIHRHWGE